MQLSLKLRKATSLTTLILLAFATSARAAALELYETGAPDLGTASAGRTALAADASTAAANPAGMTQLDRTQLLTASGALLPSTNFEIGPKTTPARGTPLGTAGGNAGVFFPVGSLFFVYLPGDGWGIGTSPNILVNWYANKSANMVTFPVGLNVSKVIKIGPLPVKLQIQGQYMPVHPEVFGQKWNLQFAVTPVIPKLIKGHLFGD